MFTALLNEIERGRIWGHLLASLTLYTLGFTLAVVVGVAVGVIAGWWRVANYMVDPWVTVLYSTPIVVFVPMIILLLGIDLWAKVFIVFLISVFTVIVNTMAGVTSTSVKLVDVARAFGANQRRQLTGGGPPRSPPEHPDRHPTRRRQCHGRGHRRRTGGR